MILIADSGSTKTDWRLIDDQGEISQATTPGLNPYYQSSQEIKLVVELELLAKINGEVSEVHFYGAGCNGIKDEVVSSPLQTLFPSAMVTIQSDLLAAARSLCGHEPGIACILGTGSNSCLYDGNTITEQTPTLGFWLGDEGSGSVMGRELVIAYLNHELPEQLAGKFEKRYQLSKKEVLHRAYEEPFPNRYFGQFSKFLFHHLKDPFVYQLVAGSFEQFFERKVLKYENHQQSKIHFVGSIAFYFSNILRQVANDRGLSVQNIIESPIAGLTLYHQSSK